MKRRFYSAMLVPVLALSGCLSNKTYDLGEFNAGTGEEVFVVDARESVEQNGRVEGPIRLIGEKQLQPPPPTLVAQNLSEMSRTSSVLVGREFELIDFVLGINEAQHQAIARGAAMAGVSYPAAIVVADQPFGAAMFGDGVIARISLREGEQTYSCDSYLPAYHAVGALHGIRVTGEKLREPFDNVIEQCLARIVSELR